MKLNKKVDEAVVDRLKTYKPTKENTMVKKAEPKLAEFEAWVSVRLVRKECDLDTAKLMSKDSTGGGIPSLTDYMENDLEKLKHVQSLINQYKREHGYESV